MDVNFLRHLQLEDIGTMFYTSYLPSPAGTKCTARHGIKAMSGIQSHNPLISFSTSSARLALMVMTAQAGETEEQLRANLRHSQRVSSPNC